MEAERNCRGSSASTAAAAKARRRPLRVGSFQLRAPAAPEAGALAGSTQGECSMQAEASTRRVDRVEALPFSPALRAAPLSERRTRVDFLARDLTAAESFPDDRALCFMPLESGCLCACLGCGVHRFRWISPFTRRSAPPARQPLQRRHTFTSQKNSRISAAVNHGKHTIRFEWMQKRAVRQFEIRIRAGPCRPGTRRHASARTFGLTCSTQLATNTFYRSDLWPAKSGLQA